MTILNNKHLGENKEVDCIMYAFRVYEWFTNKVNQNYPKAVSMYLVLSW